MIRRCLLLILTAFTMLGSGCAETAPPPEIAPRVVVAHPLVTVVGDRIELTGVVAPSASVDLIARAAGFVRAKGFTDGSFVRRGQVLFRIEPDTAAAQVALNQAKEVQARLDYARDLRLVQQDAASKAELEASRSTLEQAKANTRIARINLSYTVVRAPMSGYIGAADVDVGAYVGGAGAPTKLATLQRLEPAYVDFTLGERDVLRILAKGQGSRAAATGHSVRVGLQGEAGYPHAGRLSFANKSVDAATGSLQARAILDNGPGIALLPGVFARVRIDLGSGGSTMLLPARTIQSDPLSDFVLVVDARGLVQRRDVRTGRDLGRNREIVAGLKLSDRVVVEGLAGVRIGQKADVRTAILPAPEVI